MTEGPILRFDRDHPSAPTCAFNAPPRGAGVKTGRLRPPVGLGLDACEHGGKITAVGSATVARNHVRVLDGSAREARGPAYGESCALAFSSGIAAVIGIAVRARDRHRRPRPAASGARVRGPRRRQPFRVIVVRRGLEPGRGPLGPRGATEKNGSRVRCNLARQRQRHSSLWRKWSCAQRDGGEPLHNPVCLSKAGR